MKICLVWSSNRFLLFWEGVFKVIFLNSKQKTTLEGARTKAGALMGVAVVSASTFL